MHKTLEPHYNQSAETSRNIVSHDTRQGLEGATTKAALLCTLNPAIGIACPVDSALSKALKFDLQCDNSEQGTMSNAPLYIPG